MFEALKLWWGKREDVILIVYILCNSLVGALAGGSHLSVMGRSVFGRGFCSDLSCAGHVHEQLVRYVDPYITGHALCPNNRNASYCSLQRSPEFF